MEERPISKKQEEILNYIKNEILERGFPPAVREICQAVGLKSTSSVHSHLESLERNGYIRRDPTKPRAIEILDESFNMIRREMVNVPIIGTVAAGQPILAEQNIETYDSVPKLWRADFTLACHGDSMEPRIKDGDVVAVRRTPNVENGEIAAVRIDDEATLKHVYRYPDRLVLQPENPAFPPIVLIGEEINRVVIEGKAVGLCRSL